MRRVRLRGRACPRPHHEEVAAQRAWSPGLSGSWPDAVTLVMDPQPIHPWLYWQNHSKVEAGERRLAAWAPGVPSCLWFQRRPCSVSIGVSKQGPSASPCRAHPSWPRGSQPPRPQAQLFTKSGNILSWPRAWGFIRETHRSLCELEGGFTPQSGHRNYQPK